MASEMVERVSKAIMLRPEEYGTLDQETKRQLHETVTKALEAMREPTEAMLRDAETLDYYSDRSVSTREESVTLTWQSMVDAALKE